MKNKQTPQELMNELAKANREKAGLPTGREHIRWDLEALSVSMHDIAQGMKWVADFGDVAADRETAELMRLHAGELTNAAHLCEQWAVALAASK
jgi:hypothetical protein